MRKAKQEVDWQTVGKGWEFYLEQAGDGWRDAFVPVVRGTVEAQAVHLSTVFGMEYDVVQLLAAQWFDDYLDKLQFAIIDTTKKDVAVLMQQAILEGWSIPTMEGHLATLFGQYIKGDKVPDDFKPWFTERMPAYRRELIARTESIRSSARGSEALYKEWQIQYKQWITAIDDRTCPWCLPMDGKIIAIGESWFRRGEQWNVEVGEHMRTLRFDYEDVTGPPLHPNCRCALLPWKQEWANL